MQPLCLLERISNRNTANELTEMLAKFFDSASEIDLGPNYPMSYPSLFLTDNAPQLQTAIIRVCNRSAYAKHSVKGHPRILYSQIIGRVLLKFECLASSKAWDQTQVSVIAYELMSSVRRLGIVTFVKACTSHVFRAARDWAKKNLSSKPMQNLISMFFDWMTKAKKLSETMVLLEMIISFLERSSTTVNVGDKTWTEDSPVVELSSAEANMSDQMMREVSHRVQQYIDDEARRITTKFGATETTELWKSCDGQEWPSLYDCSALRSRLQEKIQRECCHAVLVEKKRTDDGIVQGSFLVNVVFGRSPSSKESPDGRRKVFSYKTTLTLPVEGSSFPLDFLSITDQLSATGYVKRTWYNQVAIWSHGIITLLEYDMQMPLENSNQYCESVIKELKINHCGRNGAPEEDWGLYVCRRWDDIHLTISAVMRDLRSVNDRAIAAQLESRDRRMLPCATSNTKCQLTTVERTASKSNTAGTTPGNPATTGAAEMAFSEDTAETVWDRGCSRGTRQNQDVNAYWRKRVGRTYREQNNYRGTKPPSATCIYAEAKKANCGREIDGFRYQSFLKWYTGKMDLRPNQKGYQQRRDWIFAYIEKSPSTEQLALGGSE